MTPVPLDQLESIPQSGVTTACLIKDLITGSNYWCFDCCLQVTFSFCSLSVYLRLQWFNIGL